MWKDTGHKPIRKEHTKCQGKMEQDQEGQGQAQAADSVRAAVDSEKARRQAPDRDRDWGEVAVGVGWARVAVGVGWARAKARVVARERVEVVNERKEAIMPRGDGTGPMGMGPMTGRAAGACAGFGTPGFRNQGPGRGRGAAGCGGGRGWRNMFYATGLTGWQRAAAGWPAPGGVSPYAEPTKEQELEALKRQADYFENTLGGIRKRLQELEVEETTK